MAVSKVVISSGKRKTAVARAIIKKGTGKVFINNIPLEIWEPEVARWKIMEPILLLDEETRNSIDIHVTVKGGGFMGQADAARMAIARGLVQWTGSETLKRLYEQYDRSMIAGDPRRTEPKKFGGPGARRRRQKAYR